ncbi:MAG TPA: hypothetical protein VIF62_18960 [Labilithrix sp.]|jgi:hypothetical protein
MRFAYRVVVDAESVIAECLEADVEGVGKTEKEAVESLRSALAEHMLRPDAVAPPPSAPRETIDLVRVV